MTAEQAKTPTQEEKPQTKTAEQTKSKEQATKPQVEKQTNCLACNKPIRKLKRYYRDGKFYCSKKCWRTALEKSKEVKK